MDFDTLWMKFWWCGWKLLTNSLLEVYELISFWYDHCLHRDQENRGFCVLIWKTGHVVQVWLISNGHVHSYRAKPSPLMVGCSSKTVRLSVVFGECRNVTELCIYRHAVKTWLTRAVCTRFNDAMVSPVSSIILSPCCRLRLSYWDSA